MSVDPKDLNDPVGDILAVAAAIEAAEPAKADWLRSLSRAVAAIEADLKCQAEDARVLREAVNGTLLFHSAGPWDAEKHNRWWNFAQSTEATTKALCDALRLALVRTTPDLAHNPEGDAYRCPVTGQAAVDAWTDYERPGLHNACAYCADKAPGPFAGSRKARGT